jgi:hypothetical protein
MLNTPSYPTNHEHRLHVVEVVEGRPRRHFAPHAFGDMLRELFLCGRCSILFSSAETRSILSGDAAACSNCGAWNQM